MFQELQQLIHTFSYRKAVQVLRELRHDGVELQKFNQYIDKQFAPRAIEDRVIQLIAEYYDRAAKSTPLMLSASSRLSVTDSLVHHGEVPKPEIFKDDVPAVIVKLRADQRLLRDERRAIHTTLEETMDDKLRGEKAKSIRELSKRIDKIFSTLDEYDTTGVLPALGSSGDNKAAALEVADLFTQKKYLGERIIRLNSLLKNKDLVPSKKFRYENELKVKKHLLIEVLSKISSLN